MHSAYVYVGAGLFVSAVLVVGTLPALRMYSGPVTGGDVGPTYTDTGPPTPEDVSYRGDVFVGSKGIDLDRTPPEAGEWADVAVQVDRIGPSLFHVSTDTLVKAPTGMVVRSADMCAELLDYADPGVGALRVSPDDTVCLRTDEGRIASLVVVAVVPAQGVRAKVTVWTPEVPPTQ